jgi:hypothetical protein
MIIIGRRTFVTELRNIVSGEGRSNRLGIRFRCLYILEQLLTYLVAQNDHRPSAKDLERGQNGVPQRDCPDIVPQGKGADPAR